MDSFQIFEMIGLADDKYITETDQIDVKTINRVPKKTVVLIVLILSFLLGLGAAAAYVFSMPKEMEDNLHIGSVNITKIVDLSHPENGGVQIENKTQQTGGYDVTFEAIVSGPRLYERREGWGDRVVIAEQGEDELYAVFTLKRSDGGEIPPEKPYELYYVIGEKGYKPFLGSFDYFPVATMENNVVYFACMVTHAQLFSDRELYITVTDAYPDGTVLRMDKTGAPYFLDSYTGIAALFDLPLDPAKADPEKAAEFRKGRVFVTDTDYSDADEIMRLDKEFEESGIDLSPYIGRNKWRGSYSLQFGEVRYAEIFLSRRGEWKNVKTVSYREARDFLSKGEPLPQDADTFSLPDGTVCRYMIRDIFFCIKPEGSAFTVSAPSAHVILKFTDPVNCVNCLYMDLTYPVDGVYPDVVFSACYIDGIPVEQTDCYINNQSKDWAIQTYQETIKDFACVQDAVYKIAFCYAGHEGIVQYIP